MSAADFMRSTGQAAATGIIAYKAPKQAANLLIVETVIGGIALIGVLGVIGYAIYKQPAVQNSAVVKKMKAPFVRMGRKNYSYIPTDDQ